MRLTHFLLLALSLSPLKAASDYVVPPNSGVINAVTNCGVPNNGTSDATQTLQTCISNWIGDNTRNTVIYLPAGTYKISNTLNWVDNFGHEQGYSHFQGHNQADTTIILADNSSGFGNSGSPKPMIRMNSSGAEFNAGFNNYFDGFTIRTGNGNPGATAIDMLGTNNARVSNVTVIDTAGNSQIGIDLSRNYTGPMLVSDVTVTGFATGISISGGNVSSVVNHATISGQRIQGILCGASNCFMRDITSTNTVPAVLSGEFTQTLITDSTLSGGSNTRSAIEITGGGPPQLFVRNVTSSGYQSRIKYLGNVVAGSGPGEYSSTAPLTLFTSSSTGLNLPVQNFPAYVDTNTANWVNVADFGASPASSDNTAAIQAAFDACTGSKTTVYFPYGHYNIKSHLLIRPGSTCKRITGFGGSIQPWSSSQPADQTGIIYQATSGTLVIDHLDFTNDNFQFNTAVSHTGAGILAMEESHMDGRYVASVGAGDVYLDDMAFGAFYFASGQHVWAVQLDCESDSPHVQNLGATAWIFGMTTEDLGPVVTSTSGATTEVLGLAVLLHAGLGNDTNNYMINSTDSSVSLTFGITPTFYYTHLISETRAGVTHTIDCPGGNCPSPVTPRVGNGANVALYTGFTTVVTLPVVTTTTASSLTTTTALSGGNVTSDGGASVTARGVCYSISAFPASPCTSDGIGTVPAAYTSSITGLTPGTLYNYRAFATNSSGTGYGANLTFTTAAQTTGKKSVSGAKNSSALRSR